MDSQPKLSANDDDPAPYGTRPRHSIGPTLFWALLLAVWVGVLTWMAAHIGPKA